MQEKVKKNKNKIELMIPKNHTVPTSVPLSGKLLFQNTGLNFSFIFRSTVVDYRQAPCTPTEVYLRMAFSSHRR